MNKKKHLTYKEKVAFFNSLEEFFSLYQPKFGEKIKVRRFIADLKKIQAELYDEMLKNRLGKIKDSNIQKKDIELLKTLDEESINSHFKKLKRNNNLPLIVKLMERVNTTSK